MTPFSFVIKGLSLEKGNFSERLLKKHTLLCNFVEASVSSLSILLYTAGERCLSHDTDMSALYSVNPSAQWIIKPKDCPDLL